MVRQSQKRRAIKHVVEEGKRTTAEACRALALKRSTYYRNRTVSPERQKIERTIVGLSEHPRYGYRCITALVRREGELINAKRVQRVRRQYGLQVRKKQRKQRRTGLPTAQCQRATRSNHVWSWDFVEDQTENGTRLRILTLMDECTPECLACTSPGQSGPSMSLL